MRRRTAYRFPAGRTAEKIPALTHIRRSILLIVCALNFGSSGMEAQSLPPMITDRPDFTESAATVPVALSQIELGYTFSRSGSERRHSLGELLLRTGLFKTVELRLGLNSFAVRSSQNSDVSGFEDIVIGVKIMFLGAGESQTDPGPLAMALLLAGSLPTGATAFSDGSAIPRGTLAAQYALGDVLTVSSNVSCSVPERSGTRISQFSVSLSLGVGIDDRVGVFAEAFRFTSPDTKGVNRSYVNAGMTVLLADEFQLDGRIGSSMNSGDSDYFAGLGAAVRFELF